MNLNKHIRLDPARLYGFKIVTQASDSSQPTVLGGKIGIPKKPAPLGAKIGATKKY